MHWHIADGLIHLAPGNNGKMVVDNWISFY